MLIDYSVKKKKTLINVIKKFEKFQTKKKKLSKDSVNRYLKLYYTATDY